MLETIYRAACAPVNATLHHKAERVRFGSLKQMALSCADDRGATAFAERERYHAACEWTWRVVSVAIWLSCALVVLRLIS